MILLADLLFMLSMLLFAIILIWIVSIQIINSKKIVVFLPFFISSVWLCLSAALSFYGIFDQKIWFIIELSWGIWFLWILIILIKNKNV